MIFKKKSKGKIISSATAVALLISVISSGMITASAANQGNNFVDGGIAYTVLEDTATVKVVGNNYSGDIIIPGTASDGDATYNVTEIGQSAFFGCTGLTSVTIPDSVITIGESAFNSCTGLTGIIIPDNVTVIGDWAFTGCTGLTGVTIGSSVESIGEGAFQSCSALTSVTIPDSVLSIGENAFAHCSCLTSVAIGSGVSSIGAWTFLLCSELESIYMPESVTEIDGQAFIGCSNVTIYGELGSYAQTFAEANDIPFSEMTLETEDKTALPTASSVLLNGNTVEFEAYNIEGHNYFKLRDLAQALNSTEKQFEVGWSYEENTITLTPGDPYTPVGDELTVSGDTEAKAALLTTSKVYVGSTEVEFTAYSIDGHNYFMLRDIAAEIDFGVTYDYYTNTISIDTSVGYTPD